MVSNILVVSFLSSTLLGATNSINNDNPLIIWDSNLNNCISMMNDITDPKSQLEDLHKNCSNETIKNQITDEQIKINDIQNQIAKLQNEIKIKRSEIGDEGLSIKDLENAKFAAAVIAQFSITVYITSAAGNTLVWQFPSSKALIKRITWSTFAVAVLSVAAMAYTETKFDSLVLKQEQVNTFINTISELRKNLKSRQVNLYSLSELLHL